MNNKERINHLKIIEDTLIKERKRLEGEVQRMAQRIVDIGEQLTTIEGQQRELNEGNNNEEWRVQHV